MKSIKSKNTVPEVTVRKHMRTLRVRYKSNLRSLPGSPDIAIEHAQKVIFIHGCFWHQHGAKACKLVKSPRTNIKYWLKKFARNKSRDRENLKALKALGWKSLVLWECQLTNEDRVKDKIKAFLGLHD